MGFGPALSSSGRSGTFRKHAPDLTSMSYMRAWLMVEELNRTCGCATVGSQKGGKNGGGATLTACGALPNDRLKKMSVSPSDTTRSLLKGEM
jgi:molybdenum-dependent DNA-binding transcriptional regulator ModE